MVNEKKSQKSPASETKKSKATLSPTSFDFELLSKGQKEVLIAFQGQVYRLRKTRNGRLILTK
ncbi:MAG: hemin uptake protein HemP [Planctomycetes bacterium]|nr:hemin uptake protein HemP [Planctomycetota bacterium]MCH9724207.1 hemin uptake protein HemP [Planctomycetota bacterium]MCH9778918.1 hemin uptake protein HemP [Planctomycetota bacterium]MCH9790010.1 hemin uptake protein HemP [Planctomycetota bacterium]MDF1746342.1 hemin uptake protein HemP [Gimesia sp.]